MSLSAGTFKAIANNLVGDTFAAFAKVLTMRTANTVTYGSAQTYTSEIGTGVALSLDYSALNNQLIEAGDIKIVTNASQWTTDPKGDNVDIIFDGVVHQIILVQKDADNAAYFIFARRS